MQRSGCHFDKKRAKCINGLNWRGAGTRAAPRKVRFARSKNSKVFGSLSTEVARELPRAHRIDLGHRLFHAGSEPAHEPGQSFEPLER
jgi:hypothetical protein